MLTGAQKTALDAELTRLGLRKNHLEAAMGDPSVAANFVELRRVTSELADVTEAPAVAEDAWLDLEEQADADHRYHRAHRLRQVDGRDGGSGRVRVIDADHEARLVLAPGTPEVEAVYRRFGSTLRRRTASWTGPPSDGSCSGRGSGTGT